LTAWKRFPCRGSQQGQIGSPTCRPKVTAAKVVKLDGNRWSIERALGELTLPLRGEVETLGDPCAALLADAIADVSSAGKRTCQKLEREPHQARRGSRPDLLANG
jgi:hypothetical protein